MRLPSDACVQAASEARRARASCRPRGGGPTLLVLGRLAWQKRVETIVSAAPAILAAFPGLRVVVVGEGAEEPRLRSQVEAQGLTGVVHFAGPSLDTGQWFAQADLFVSASVLEGHPLAAIEAMSWRVPVLLSDIGPHRELAGADRGRLVPPSDPPALGRAVVEALNDWPGTEARADRAADYVVRHCSLQEMARRHMDLYRAVSSR